MLAAKLRSRVPQILRNKAWRLEGKAGVEVVGHRAYIGGKWDEYGQMEFDFMIGHGLRPEHVLLDIACGSLRAGVHFIPYLEAGHYLGIEKEQSLIDSALAKELAPAVREEKRPELVVSADFEFDKFSKQADYSLAWSLFTHLNTVDLDKCLGNLRAYAAPGHQLFATFLPGESDRNDPRSHAHARFYYPPEVMIATGERHGFQCNYIGDISREREMRMHMMQFTAQ
jgi:hypothetical protein